LNASEFAAPLRQGVAMGQQIVWLSVDMLLAQASSETVMAQMHTFSSAQEFKSEGQGRWNGQNYLVPNEGNYFEARIPDEVALPNWRHDLDPSRASYGAMGTQSACSADRTTRFPSNGQLFRSRVLKRLHP
jgi:hypothetical protein